MAARRRTNRTTGEGAHLGRSVTRRELHPRRELSDAALLADAARQARHHTARGAYARRRAEAEAANRRNQP